MNAVPLSRGRACGLRQRTEVTVYNLLDLTLAGRGEWYARLDYGVDVHWGAYRPKA